MKTKVTVLSGGVGGSKLVRGFAALDDVDLTAVVNVGDDETIYGMEVSPDIDTVVYSLADQAGAQGWGLSNDTQTVLDALEKFPIDTWFRIGDRDLATNLFRTARARQGWTLSQIITAQAAVFGLEATVLPATDHPVRTEVHIVEDGWTPFQSYFVGLSHQPEIDDIRFSGAWASLPAPGVLEALRQADVVVIGPSNPPLSIWPILAVEGIAEEVGTADRVVAVSPLFAGRALKGPADRVMAGLGLPAGTAGVIAAYDGLIHELLIDFGDAADASLNLGPTIRTAPTRMKTVDDAARLARIVLAG